MISKTQPALKLVLEGRGLEWLDVGVLADSARTDELRSSAQSSARVEQRMFCGPLSIFRFSLDIAYSWLKGQLRQRIRDQ